MLVGANCIGCTVNWTRIRNQFFYVEVSTVYLRSRNAIIDILDTFVTTKARAGSHVTNSWCTKFDGKSHFQNTNEEFCILLSNLIWKEISRRSYFFQLCFNTCSKRWPYVNRQRDESSTGLSRVREKYTGKSVYSSALPESPTSTQSFLSKIFLFLQCTCRSRSLTFVSILFTKMFKWAWFILLTKMPSDILK